MALRWSVAALQPPEPRRRPQAASSCRAAAILRGRLPQVTAPSAGSIAERPRRPPPGPRFLPPRGLSSGGGGASSSGAPAPPPAPAPAAPVEAASGSGRPAEVGAEGTRLSPTEPGGSQCLNLPSRVSITDGPCLRVPMPPSKRFGAPGPARPYQERLPVGNQDGDTVRARLLQDLGCVPSGPQLLPPSRRRAKPARWSSMKVHYTELIDAVNGTCVEELLSALAAVGAVRGGAQLREFAEGEARLRQLVQLRENLQAATEGCSTDRLRKVLEEARLLQALPLQGETSGGWRSKKAWPEAIAADGRLRKLAELQATLDQATRGTSIEDLVAQTQRATELGAKELSEVLRAEARILRLRSLQERLEEALAEGSREGFEAALAFSEILNCSEDAAKPLGPLLALAKERVKVAPSRPLCTAASLRALAATSARAAPEPTPVDGSLVATKGGSGSAGGSAAGVGRACGLEAARIPVQGERAAESASIAASSAPDGLAQAAAEAAAEATSELVCQLHCSKPESYAQPAATAVINAAAGTAVEAAAAERVSPAPGSKPGSHEPEAAAAVLEPAARTAVEAAVERPGCKPGSHAPETATAALDAAAGTAVDTAAELVSPACASKPESHAHLATPAVLDDAAVGAPLEAEELNPSGVDLLQQATCVDELVHSLVDDAFLETREQESCAQSAADAAVQEDIREDSPNLIPDCYSVEAVSDDGFSDANLNDLVGSVIENAWSRAATPTMPRCERETIPPYWAPVGGTADPCEHVAEPYEANEFEDYVDELPVGVFATTTGAYASQDIDLQSVAQVHPPESPGGSAQLAGSFFGQVPSVTHISEDSRQNMLATDLIDGAMMRAEASLGHFNDGGRDGHEARVEALPNENGIGVYSQPEFMDAPVVSDDVPGESSAMHDGDGAVPVAVPACVAPTPVQAHVMSLIVEEPAREAAGTHADSMLSAAPVRVQNEDATSFARTSPLDVCEQTAPGTAARDGERDITVAGATARDVSGLVQEAELLPRDHTVSFSQVVETPNRATPDSCVVLAAHTMDRVMANLPSDPGVPPSEMQGDNSGTELMSGTSNDGHAVHLATGLWEGDAKADIRVGSVAAGAATSAAPDVELCARTRSVTFSQVIETPSRATPELCAALASNTMNKVIASLPSDPNESRAESKGVHSVCESMSAISNDGLAERCVNNFDLEGSGVEASAEATGASAASIGQTDLLDVDATAPREPQINTLEYDVIVIDGEAARDATGAPSEAMLVPRTRTETLSQVLETPTRATPDSCVALAAHTMDRVIANLPPEPSTSQERGQDSSSQRGQTSIVLVSGSSNDEVAEGLIHNVVAEQSQGDLSSKGGRAFTAVMSGSSDAGGAAGMMNDIIAEQANRDLGAKTGQASTAMMSASSNDGVSDGLMLDLLAGHVEVDNVANLGRSSTAVISGSSKDGVADDVVLDVMAVHSQVEPSEKALRASTAVMSESSSDGVADSLVLNVVANAEDTGNLTPRVRPGSAIPEPKEAASCIENEDQVSSGVHVAATSPLEGMSEIQASHGIEARERSALAAYEEALLADVAASSMPAIADHDSAHSESAAAASESRSAWSNAGNLQRYLVDRAVQRCAEQRAQSDAMSGSSGRSWEPFNEAALPPAQLPERRSPGPPSSAFNAASTVQSASCHVATALAEALAPGTPSAAAQTPLAVAPRSWSPRGSLGPGTIPETLPESCTSLTNVVAELMDAVTMAAPQRAAGAAAAAAAAAPQQQSAPAATSAARNLVEAALAPSDAASSVAVDPECEPSPAPTLGLATHGSS